MDLLLKGGKVQKSAVTRKTNKPRLLNACFQ